MNSFLSWKSFISGLVYALNLNEHHPYVRYQQQTRDEFFALFFDTSYDYVNKHHTKNFIRVTTYDNEMTVDTVIEVSLNGINFEYILHHTISDFWVEISLAPGMLISLDEKTLAQLKKIIEYLNDQFGVIIAYEENGEEE